MKEELLAIMWWTKLTLEKRKKIDNIEFDFLSNGYTHNRYFFTYWIKDSNEIFNFTVTCLKGKL